ncbi:hypothetical protein UlMin_026622 [Ulmus minor]
MEFVREPFVEKEIDMDYEFDAARFYDFTRDETNWEIEEAEQWFEFAGSYLPSPFFFKLNWRKLSSKSEDVNKNNREAKARSLVKSKRSGSSTLMKPTASQLAKQVQPQLLHTIQRLRFGRKLGKIDEKSLQNSSVADNLATKRQKLEAGYLSKVAELKHQPLLSHKSPKRAGPDVISASPRRKATTPREFDLETAHRAERRRIKIDAELAEQAKPNASIFKARPLNRKILEATSLPLPNRSRPQLPEFQEFHLKTSERTMQHKLNNLCHNKHSSNESNVPIFTIISQKEIEEDKRLNSVNSLRQEKCEVVCNFNDSPLQKKELKFVADKRDEPPIYLFSKLSLTSGGQHSTNSRSKGPLSIKLILPITIPFCIMINVVKKRPKRLVGKEYKCACDRPELQQVEQILHTTNKTSKLCDIC